MLAYILIPLALVLLLLVLCREIKETYDMPLDINRPHQEQQPDPVKDQKHAQKEKDTVCQINTLRVLYGARIGPENIEDDQHHQTPHDHHEMPIQPSDPVTFQQARRLRIREEEESEPESLMPMDLLPVGEMPLMPILPHQTPLVEIADQFSLLGERKKFADQDKSVTSEGETQTTLDQPLYPTCVGELQIFAQEAVSVDLEEAAIQADVQTEESRTNPEVVTQVSIGIGDPLDQTTQGVQCDVIREIVRPIHFTVTGNEPVATENQEIQTSVILPLDLPQDESISPIRNSPESAVLLEEELQGVAVETILQQDRSRRRSVLSQLAPIREEEVEESPLVGIRRFDDVLDEQNQFHLSRVISTQSIPISEDQSSLHIGLNSFQNVRIAPVINRPDQSFNFSDIRTINSQPIDREEEVSRFVTISPMVSRSSSQDHEEDH